MNQKCYIQPHLDEFLATGKHSPLSRMMFSDAQWNEIFTRLASRGISVCEYTMDGHIMIKLVNRGRPDALTAAKRVELMTRFPHLGGNTINALLAIPMYSLSRAQVMSALQYARAPYDISRDDFDNIHTKIRAANGNGVVVRDTPAWTFVGASHYNINPSSFNIAVNANLSTELIDKMNKLVKRDAGKVINNYRIASSKNFDSVMFERAPLVIATKKRDNAIEGKISNIVAPYVRITDGLLGQRLAYGMFITPQPVSGELWYAESLEILNILRNSKTK